MKKLSWSVGMSEHISDEADARRFMSHDDDAQGDEEYQRTALFAAARQGNYEVVQALLSCGADVNVTDIRGQTALLTAVGEGNLEMVQYLLSRGASGNVADGSGRTALFIAAQQGNYEVVQALLSHGTDVNVTDVFGQTALLAAAKQGNVSVVQALLCHGADESVTVCGQTALFIASGQGNVEVVQALLSHDTDVNMTDESGLFALSFVAFQGNVEMVETLMSHVADESLTYKWGCAALCIAALQDNVEMVKALLSHAADESMTDKWGQAALYIAAKQGNVEVVKALLSHGADESMTDKWGQAALCIAAKQGNVEVVKALLSHGADESMTDKWGQAALCIAADQGNVEMVKALLSHAADESMTDKWGQAALIIAAGQGNVEVVQALLSHGADKTVTDKWIQNAVYIAACQGNVEVIQSCVADGNITEESGFIALLYAVHWGNVEMVESLLSHESVTDKSVQTVLFIAAGQGIVKGVEAFLRYGADVNMTNECGQTALFIAAGQGNVEVVQALLSHDADVNMTDEFGQTALFIAAGQGNVEVVQALLSHDADVNMTGKSGQTALFIAAGQGNVEVVQALLSHDADVNMTDESGQTALFIAAGQGNVNMTDVNMTDESGQTALFTATRQGNVEVVQVLLSHDANVNVTDQHGRSVLFSAAEQGDFEVVQALLSHGADVNIVANDGQTCLFAAGGHTSVDTFNLLVNHGADPHKTDDQNETVLFHAIRNGNLSLIRHLVEHEGVDVNTVNHSGNSALFCLVHLIEAGHSAHTVIELFKLLCEHGADCNVINEAGENVLFHCLSYGNRFQWYLFCEENSWHELTVVCQFLMEKIDVHARPKNGNTVIVLVLRLLLRFLKRNSRKELATQEGKPSVVEGLFGLVSSVFSSSIISETAANVRDDADGDTPLHLWASLPLPQNPCFDQLLRNMADKLFEFGAQINSTNGHGETPLHVAQTWTAIDVLLSKGAATNATDHQGNTPLLSLIQHGVLLKEGSCQLIKPQVAMSDNANAGHSVIPWKQLFKYGFDPLKSNTKGETALNLLLKASTFDVIQTFLEASAALKLHRYLVDSNGDTPLHVICRDEGEGNFSKLNLIDSLVKSQPLIVSFANRNGDTALHVVCQKELISSLSLEVVRRLRTYGAQIDTPNVNDQTCLDLVSNKPELNALLGQEVTFSEVEPWIPWTSKSKKHKDKLGQVARGQNSQQTGSLSYHTAPIGLGSFGRVHAGINPKDGREVAVKCLERARMCRPEDQNEIRKLVQLADCEHVVRYLNYHGDKDFLYIELELMEGTLAELLDGGVRDEDKGLLCKQILDGVSFLHQRNIIHRDIKLTNVLYKCEPKLCVKLADFGLSGKATKTDASTYPVMHSKAGTRCWMAPEILTKDGQHSVASDVFSCGLLLHFVFSDKHPFAPENTSNKNKHLIECETVTNIEKKALSLHKSLPLEATHLVKSMLHSEKEKRPSAADSATHPLFWSNKKKMQFLWAVGNEPEVGVLRHLVHSPSLFEQELERELSSRFASTWDNAILQIYHEMTSSKRSRKYVTHSAVDLVRFVRNTWSHPDQLSPAMCKSVKEDFALLKKFPTLLMDVYQSVIKHNWNRRQAIESAMTEEWGATWLLVCLWKFVLCLFRL